MSERTWRSVVLGDRATIELESSQPVIDDRPMESRAMSSLPSGGPTRRVTAQRPPPGPTTIIYDVAWLDEPDVRVVDALARLHLAARRSGREVVLQGAGTHLEDLVELMGLREVLRVEAVGEAEQREQALGVEEEGDPAEPVA